MIRRSFEAIETARAASPRSWASMKLASSERSASLGSPADQCGPLRGHVGLQGRAGPLQRAVHGRDRGVQRRCRLACRPAQHVARDQRRALARRQDLQRGEERELDGLARHDDGIGLILGRCHLVEQAVGIRA